MLYILNFQYLQHRFVKKSDISEIDEKLFFIFYFIYSIQTYRFKRLPQVSENKMSQTPRCALPTIVVEDAPKVSTIRGLHTAQTPAQRNIMVHDSKMRFREMFAHASKSQVKSLISMLSKLNEANWNYHMMLVSLKPDSKLRFKVNDKTQGVERNFEVDKNKVELGRLTFEKGLRNVYFYYKFRGTKASKRTGDKEADDLADLTNFRNFHRHLWVIAGSPLHQWLMSETFTADDGFNSTVRQFVNALTENESPLREYKGGNLYLHILSSTIQNLLLTVFETNEKLKIKANKSKDIPREMKQAQYMTTPAIQGVYNGRATHQIGWDVSTNKPKTNMNINLDVSYTIIKGLQDKFNLRRQEKQYVYQAPEMSKIYLKDFMSVISLGSVSAELIHFYYNNFRDHQVSQSNLQAGQAFSSGVMSYEEFRGDNVFRDNLVKLQQYVNSRYKDLKSRNLANAPSTVRASFRNNLTDILFAKSTGGF